MNLRSSDPEAVPSTPTVEVVICTYNRADQLTLAMEALATQDHPHDGRWAVLVVDNNCTDHTSEVVDGFRNRLPGLRMVSEQRQGLTEARQQGFWSTESPWVAFVDDDCLVESDWIRHVLNFVDRRPEAAGFNGRNVLHLEGPPRPWVRPEMFAGKNHGDDDEIVAVSLHGAGMVLRRDAVLRSGWLANPRSADRRGKSLVSGGDNELAIRTGAAGGDLWYVPQCRLHHVVSDDRLRFDYLVRLSYRLAESRPLLQSMMHRGGGLYLRFGKSTGVHLIEAVSPRGGRRVRRRVLELASAAGFIAGVIKFYTSPSGIRSQVIGLATPERVDQLTAPGS